MTCRITPANPSPLIEAPSSSPGRTSRPRSAPPAGSAILPRSGRKAQSRTPTAAPAAGCRATSTSARSQSRTSATVLTPRPANVSDGEPPPRSSNRICWRAGHDRPTLTPAEVAFHVARTLGSGRAAKVPRSSYIPCIRWMQRFASRHSSMSRAHLFSSEHCHQIAKRLNARVSRPPTRSCHEACRVKLGAEVIDGAPDANHSCLGTETQVVRHIRTHPNIPANR